MPAADPGEGDGQVSEALVKYTFFKKRLKVGSLQLYPLTAGRLIVLEQRGNPLAGGGAGDEPDPFSLYEALLVASSDAHELADLCMLDDDEWQRAVRAFGFDLPDEVINSFQEVIEAEMEAIQKSMTQPKKKAARKTVRRAPVKK